MELKPFKHPDGEVGVYQMDDGKTVLAVLYKNGYPIKGNEDPDDILNNNFPDADAYIIKKIKAPADTDSGLLMPLKIIKELDLSD